ncbi:MAG: hypothetical protein N2450_09480 [bacterium]|nr:hypothetical protein [bacterium]
MDIPFQVVKRSQDLALLSQATFTSERHLGVGLDFAITPILNHLSHSYSVYPFGTFYGGHIEFMPLSVGTIAKEVASFPKSDPNDVYLLKEWSSMELHRIGTQLFDRGWRALFLLIGLMIGWFVYQSSNLTKALGVCLYLILYNVPLWIFRFWQFRTGWKLGRNGLSYLKSLPLDRFHWIIRWLGAGFVGIAFVITSKEWGSIVFAFGKHLAEELAWISVAIGFLIGYLLSEKLSLYFILFLFSVVVFSIGILF